MSFFTRVMGFDEEEYGATQQRLLQAATFRETRGVAGQVKEYCAINGQGGVPVSCGTFSTPSVRELHIEVQHALGDRRVRAAFAAGSMVGSSQNGNLTIQNIPGESNSMHSDPNLIFSTVQAASQFNNLEFPNQNVTPEDGVSNYEFDRTQGPACAIACAAGTVYRNYLCRSEDSPTGVRGQTHDRQFNGLQGVEDILRQKHRVADPWVVKNGYIESSDQVLTNPTLTRVFGEPANRRELVEALRIGVHEDVQVTNVGAGCVPGDMMPDPRLARYGVPHQMVTQTYNSAVSIGYSDASSSAWKPLATMVLDATYEATLLVGILNAAKHAAKHGVVPSILLTKVGGGVFKNEQAWIQSAIVQGCRNITNKYGALPINVKIVHYGQVERGYEPLEGRSFEVFPPWLMELPMSDEHRALFISEELDEEAFLLLEDDNLKTLGIMAGPRKKLMAVIAERRPGSACGRVQPKQGGLGGDGMSREGSSTGLLGGEQDNTTKSATVQQMTPAPSPGHDQPPQGPSFPPPEEETAPSPTTRSHHKQRVGTCNVLYERHYSAHCKVPQMPPSQRLDLWTRFCYDPRSVISSCGIVCLQEMPVQSASWEGPLTGAGFEVEYSSTRTGGDSTAVAWLKRSFCKVASSAHSFGGGKTAVKVLLRDVATGDLITTVSAHLPSFRMSEPNEQRDILLQLHQWSLEMISGCSVNLEHDTTVVVAGDFNLRPYQTLCNLNRTVSQADLQARGETLPIFSPINDWVDLTLPFEWSSMGAQGASRIDFILQRTSDTSLESIPAGWSEQSPVNSSQLIKHAPMAEEAFGPAYGSYFSDHAFLGVELTCRMRSADVGQPAGIAEPTGPTQQQVVAASGGQVPRTPPTAAATQPTQPSGMAQQPLVAGGGSEAPRTPPHTATTMESVAVTQHPQPVAKSIPVPEKVVPTPAVLPQSQPQDTKALQLELDSLTKVVRDLEQRLLAQNDTQIVLEHAAASAKRENLPLLMWAAKYDRVDLIAQYTSRAVDLSSWRDTDGRTALHYAAEFGSLRVLKQLIAHQRSLVDVEDKFNATAWTLAVHTKQYAAADILRHA